jgi:hypothetical protein
MVNPITAAVVLLELKNPSWWGTLFVSASWLLVARSCVCVRTCVRVCTCVCVCASVWVYSTKWDSTAFSLNFWIFESFFEVEKSWKVVQSIQNFTGNRLMQLLEP